MISHERKSFTFVIIATGSDYFDMAMTLVKTIRNAFSGDCQVVLLTDLPVSHDERLNIDTCIKIESLKWPEASALRFEIMNANKDEFTGDVIIYLDADTIVNSHFGLNDVLPNHHQMFFVEHPGYFNRDILRNIYKRLIKSSWETDRKSWSRVPILKRRKYVYGAIFGGRKEFFLKMVEVLAKETAIDISRGFYPRSYDESYLNSWFSRYGGNLLSPRFAWTSKFPWLSSIYNPVIEIFEKDSAIVSQKKILDKN